jgi:hypothetical protein
VASIVPGMSNSHFGDVKPLLFTELDVGEKGRWVNENKPYHFKGKKIIFLFTMSFRKMS